MRRFLVILLFLPALAVAQELVFLHVRLFDGERAVDDAFVRIRGDRIVSVQSESKRPAPPIDARIIDGKGLTLLPGLIDSHTHIQSREDLLVSLAFGVTTDLSLHGQPSSDREIRGGLSEKRASDRADLFTAGFAATVPGGHGTEDGFDVPTIQEPSQAAADAGELAVVGGRHQTRQIGAGGSAARAP